MKTYKVITMKDKWTTGKFDPAVLESTLNSYAKQGWVVCNSITANVPGLLSGAREELIVILERDVVTEADKPRPAPPAQKPQPRNDDSSDGVYRL
jgi:hypothetical protein